MSSVLNAILRLVDAGFPRETAEKIVMGELPMDPASKAARMKEQGFDPGQIRYHATDDVFGAFDDAYLGQVTSANAIDFDEGSWANNLAMLGHWTSDRPLAEAIGAERSMPLVLRGQRQDFDSLDELSDAITNAGGVKAFQDDLLSEGFGGVNVRDEEFGGLSQVTFRPQDIRSPEAAFDPDQVGSPNLLAGLGPAAIGAGLLGASMAPEEAEAAGFGTLARAIGRPTRAAYTGSAAKYARPSLQSVGTGEGNQAFGYGLYFSESPEIAGGYRRGVAGQKVLDRMSDRYLMDDLDLQSVDEMLDLGEFSAEDEKLMRALQDADYLGFDRPMDAVRAAFGPDLNAFDASDPAVQKLKGIADEVGFLYEVEVPADDFIDWNLTLEEQPEVVQQVVRQNAQDPRIRDKIDAGSFRGSDAYYLFGNNPEVNSMMWAQYGVPGVRYNSFGRAVRGLDDARARKDAPQNYVIFDENLINIVRRNDEALENNFDERAAQAAALDVRKPLAVALAAGAAGAAQAGQEDDTFGAYDPAAVNLIDQQLAELQQRSRGQAGRTQRPQIDSITGADVLGGLEAAGTIGSALLGAVPAGLEGLFKLARTGDVREAGQRAEEIQSALMYEPRTEEGMRALEATGSFLEPLGALGPFLGEKVLELTGSPELATAADVFAPDPTQIIPGLAGLKVLSSALPPIRVGRRTARPAPEGTRAHNLPSPLLVQGPGGKPATPVVQTFTPGNTEKVLEQIEAVKANNPSALSSTTNWLRMEGDAFGGDFLPAPPMRAIQYNINPEALAAELQRLTPELKAGVDEGFEYVKQIRNVYNSEQADPALTGRLFTWGILSRGAGPVQQEAAFIDLLDNAQPFIEKAARGEFTEADIDAWTAMVSRSLPEGSPAKQVTMNANAAGRLLFELGKKPEGSDQTVLQQLHGILSDPNRTGREFRREFFRLTDKPGIDNKVVSFIGMVAGKDDLLIMDRIQTRNLWDDGRFEGANIYDGIREGNAKGGFNAILAGPRGLLVTEALEDGLIEPVRRAYEIIGRPEDASLARMHWETWNIGGNQAVSHSTLQNVRTGTSIGGAVTGGKRGTFSSGVTYRQAINGPITEYPLSDGSFVRMTPERQKEFEAFIKDPKNGIVPKGFKVSSAQDRPWYEMPGINREKLDETARRFENANADGSLQSGARRVVEGGSTVSERRGGFLRALRGDRLAQQLAGRSGGLDSRGPSFTYEGRVGTDDEGARLLTLEPSEEVASRYQFAGLNVPALRQQPADSQVEYVASMRAALEDNPAREQVYIPDDPNELAGARFFRTDNGSGFAIKEDGDVTAVFTDPSEPGGSAYSMLEAAVQAGGRKLDAFDTYLPKIYETVGFRPVARLRWDDRQAPPGWDKAKYAKYNNGEPDVVFFVFDPAYQGQGGAKNVPYVDTYDQGMDVQNAEMARISPEVEAYLRQARPAESSGVASLDPEPMAAGGAVRRPMPPAGIDTLKAYQLRL